MYTFLFVYTGISRCETQLRNYPTKFALRMLRLRHRLYKAKSPLQQPPDGLDARELFSSAVFEDVWADAQMPECLAYIKGNTSLAIPTEWRDLLPKAL